jgi:hypothetical protein
MDYKELKEIERVLQNHEESIQEHKKLIFLATTKIHENEQWEVTQAATIMSTLIQYKSKIVFMEVVIFFRIWLSI